MRYELLTTIVVVLLMVAVALMMLDRQPAPPPERTTDPHPRVMEATRPLVVYTVERPAPRARVWAIEERAAWYEPPEPVPESAPTVSEPMTAFSVIPEPTPILPPATERDHMAGLTRDDVRAAARAAGWPASEIETVVRVAECESGLRTTAVGALGELGILQVRPEYHGPVPSDLVGQLAQAYRIWAAQGWLPWSCAR